jgi:hypothetical protein
MGLARFIYAQRYLFTLDVSVAAKYDVVVCVGEMTGELE